MRRQLVSVSLFIYVIVAIIECNDVLGIIRGGGTFPEFEFRVGEKKLFLIYSLGFVFQFVK